MSTPSSSAGDRGEGEPIGGATVRPLRPLAEAPRPAFPRWGAATRIVRGLAVTAACSVALCAAGCARAAPAASAPAPPRPVVVAVQPVRYGGYFPTTEEWVRLPVQIVFEEGSALDEADRTVLRGISDAFAVENQTLGRGIVRVRASGYSDLQREQPPGLGMARAEAVVEFFVTERGIPRQFFEVVDMGDGAAAGAAVDQASPSRVELMFLVHRQYDFEAPPDTEGQAPD